MPPEPSRTDARGEGTHPKSTTELSQQLKGDRFRPSDFMRARHPELFSDSSVTSLPTLTKEVFQYHLELLTSRKEETVFEHFCRRLAEKELCPNLSPQTGPTGGGDSKCDAETYPVAEQIALRWYEGHASVATQERWAFAFSAKQEWRSKVRSDVRGIAETRRGYDLIYFITSRFARDKTKAALEDELTRAYGVKVRILDRNWILKCVFEHDRLELAVETLNLDEANVKARKTAGPRDVRNTARLRETEERLQDTGRYLGVEYQLGEDCIRAALLARTLELPRVEIEGRFDRAERIAREVGNQQQQLRVAYNRAWTAYWWFEDTDEFNRLYSQVEAWASTSDEADDLELLGNLWTVLHTSCAAGTIDESVSDRKRRTATLVGALEKCAADISRPNNSLWARTQLLLKKLTSAVNKPDEIGPLLADLRKILQTADGLVTYPFEPIARIVEELGEWLSTHDEYDALLEKVADIAQKRVGAQESGRILLAGGFHKIRAGRSYDAIRLFGRAQQKLALHESLDELAEALFGCGLAYESVGLLWAARANALVAADLTLKEYLRHGRLGSRASTCVRRIVWLEIQLGRVAFAMQWMQLAFALARNRGLDEDEKKKFSEQAMAQDATIGMLFLRSELKDLNRLRFLPDVLEKCGLEFSRMALLYALGYEDLLREEGSIPSTESVEQVLDFFTMWLKQPGSTDLPPRLTDLGAGTMLLVSQVIGCTLTVHSEEDEESVLLAERILAATEAMLATSLEFDIFPQRAEFSINVERSNQLQGLPRCEFDESSSSVTVRHSGTIPNAVGSHENWLLEIVLKIVGHLVILPNPEKYAERVFGDELGLARAINFTESGTPIRNILGHAPKFRLSDWNNEENPRAFTVRREAPWHQGLLQSGQEKVSAEPIYATGDPPKELLDRSAVKHTERKVLSLINMPLWDKAKWRGTLYLWTENPDHEPLVGLAFADSDSGKAIFREWRAKLGDVDASEQLQLSIVTGIDKSHPFSYRVVVGCRIPADHSGVREFVSISRIHRMDPQDSENLEAFRVRYERLRRYWILPAFLADVSVKPEPFFDLAIGKQSIRIRPAWEIGDNDPDSVAIDPEEEPVVPPEIKDPPVLRLLDRRRRKVTK